MTKILFRWILILGAVVAAMGTVTVYDLVAARSRDQGSCPRCRQGIPFRCTECGAIRGFTIRELQKRMPLSPQMKGPMILACEACGKKTLTHAVECPNCTEIFVIKTNPEATAVLSDHCPKCKKSYAEAWKQKYKKYQN